MTQIASFQPYQFSKIAEFQNISSTTNGAGVSVKSAVTAFSLHYYQKQKTITQKYLALNTEYQDSLIIVVRHDERINKSMLVKLDSKTYNIVDISSDDTNYISYDYVTISQVNKVGG